MLYFGQTRWSLQLFFSKFPGFSLISNEKCCSSCEQSVLSILFTILKINLKENSELAEREIASRPVRCVHLMELKLLALLQKLTSRWHWGGWRVLAYSFMDDESMQNRNNPGEGVWKYSAFALLLSFVGMNRYCGLNYLRPLNDDIISSTTIDLKLF